MLDFWCQSAILNEINCNANTTAKNSFFDYSLKELRIKFQYRKLVFYPFAMPGEYNSTGVSGYLLASILTGDTTLVWDLITQ